MPGNRGSGGYSACRKLYHTIAVWPHRLATTFGWDPAGLQDVSTMACPYRQGSHRMQRADVFGMGHVSWVVGGIMVGSHKKSQKLQIAKWGSGLKPSRRGPRFHPDVLPAICGWYFGGTNSIFLGSKCNSFGSTVPYIEQARNRGKCAYCPYPSAQIIARPKLQNALLKNTRRSVFRREIVCCHGCHQLETKGCVRLFREAVLCNHVWLFEPTRGVGETEPSAGGR